jgi:hypothetical protein
MDYEDSTYKNIAISIAQCVRDWSGILCEVRTSDFGLRTTDYGIFLSEKKTKASKDIAESPTAIAGTPKIET